MLKHHELNPYLSSALIKVLYYHELTFLDYLTLGIYLYRFSELINSFVVTTSIEGDDGMLKHHELNPYYLSDLGGMLYYPEMTYPVLPSIYFTDSHELR
jgi:hypothetical protein